MTTQPAGEHHTGTLNLTGQGNPAQSPICDDLADAVLAVKERGVSCPPNCDYQTHRRAEVRAELEAAYPAIRQQVAEQIAAAIAARRDSQAELPLPDQVMRGMKIYMTEAVDLAREIGRGA